MPDNELSAPRQSDAIETRSMFAQLEEALTRHPVCAETWRFSLVTLEMYGIERLRISTRRPRLADVLMTCVFVCGFLGFLYVSYMLVQDLFVLIIPWFFAALLTWGFWLVREVSTTSHHLYLFDNGFALKQGTWVPWRHPQQPDHLWDEIATPSSMYTGEGRCTLLLGTLELDGLTSKEGEVLIHALSQLKGDRAPARQIAASDAPDTEAVPTQDWTSDDDW